MEIGMGLLDQFEEDFQPSLRGQLPIVQRVGLRGLFVTAELGDYALHCFSLSTPLVVSYPIEESAADPTCFQPLS
jgi:hypothetical protein